MEVQKFKTLVKNDHNLGGNEYVLGRISGIGLMVKDYEELTYPIQRIDEGNIITMKCTLAQYENFINAVDLHYPELCEFYY